MDAQEEAYQNSSKGVVCLRKHLIWYAKGWPGAKLFREQGGLISSFTEARNLVEEFYNQLKSQGITHRSPDSSGQFSWEPKWDMDRREDRGVGDDMIEVTS